MSGSDKGLVGEHDRSVASPTPYPDLNAVLARFVGALQSTLADCLVGAYLQGSFAVGDFDEHSDCDFIVVTRAELDNEDVAGLQRIHGATFDLPAEWAKHLEGSYFPAATLRCVDTVGTPLWYLDHGSRSLVRSNHCNTLLVRAVLREHGVTLAGPAPRELLAPITADA